MSLAPPKPSPLAPGFRLDRYELLCPIAQGGMAQVWVARMRGKHGFEKLVAIKTILPDFAADPRFERMFLDEARIASQIEHANVAQVLDLGDERGVLYLVMEWVEGDALSKLQRAVDKKGEKLPLGIALRIVADASAGLHAAHDLVDREGNMLGVVHRDVSPQNILVNSSGVVKVIDFGIAKARDRLAGETSTGFLKGKVQYMAPEQALGKAIDRRADVWALGAVLYHLLAGKPAYDADNQLATLHLLTSGRPPLPIPAERAPAPVAAVLRKALSHDPELRYGTAAELQRAIEAAASEAKAVASGADVAAFVTTYMSERADARRQAVDLALAAAAERARVEKLLVPAAADSSASGVSAPSSLRVAEALSSPGFEERPSAKLTIADLPRPRRLAEEPLSELSSATLGSAALEAVLPQPSSRKRTAILGAAGAMLAIGVTALVSWRAGVATATASAPASATVAATAPAAATAETSIPIPPPIPPPIPTPSSNTSSNTTSTPTTNSTTKSAPHPRPKPPAAHPAPTPARPKTIDDGF